MVSSTNSTVTDESKVSREVDNSRGSYLWFFNHYRTYILTNLLNDMVEAEDKGFDEERCRLVRLSLEHFVNASTEVPNAGIFTGKALHIEIAGFLEVYRRWNDIEGDKMEQVVKRRKKIRELRKRRQAISNKVRRLQYELANNLDQQLLTDAYSAIGEIIGSSPAVFKHLSSAYSKYKKYAEPA